MSRLPVLVRLTAAFAVAMLAMLAAAAMFVGVRLGNDLDDRIAASLRARSQAVAEAYSRHTDLSNVPLEDREEGFVQVLDSSGVVVEQSGTIDEPAITAGYVSRAEGHMLMLDRELAGIDGRARLLVRSAPVDGESGVIVVGQSLVDRQEALSSVVTSFALGGLAAVLLASVLGYALARAGLAPVERMRSKAELISLSGSPEVLPLPIAHDEVRRLGETLNDMLQRLREAFDRERRFVADASHEIRTPLATIRLELEGSLRDDSLGPHSRAGLAAAHAECLRLSRLADDLLVLARLDDGRLPLRPVEVDVRATIMSVAHVHTVALSEGGRRLKLHVAPGLVVVADPDRFRQLVTNLVDNALRHGAGTVLLTAASKESGVELTVADEGPGFSPEFPRQAFNRFSRAEDSRSGDGAGLGLSLVSTIATAHGGRAWIRPGAPTAVCVWLPLPAVGSANEPEKDPAVRSHPRLI